MICLHQGFFHLIYPGSRRRLSVPSPRQIYAIFSLKNVLFAQNLQYQKSQIVNSRTQFQLLRDPVLP